MTRSLRAGAEARFAAELSARLEPIGFVLGGSHLVRRRDGVVEVVEVQHSVYGRRVTANLGLDLEWLRPLVRWIRRPAIGPHAHDCLRWIRVGLVEGGRGDRWWVYDEEDEASVDAAATELAGRVVGPGLAWLELERTPEAFLAHAERAVQRSRSPNRPMGGYLELRLLAAVQAWRGDFTSAQATCAHAGELWAEERARLVQARDIYRRRHPKPLRLPPVPELHRELERLTEPTTGERALRKVGALRRPRTSPGRC